MVNGYASEQICEYTAYFTSLCLCFLFCKIKIVVPVLISQDGCENRNKDQVLLLTILCKCKCKVLKMWLGLITFPFIPIAVAEVYSCIHPSYSLLHTQIWSLKTTVTFWSEEKLGALQASRSTSYLSQMWPSINDEREIGRQYTSASLPLGWNNLNCTLHRASCSFSEGTSVR